MYERSGEDPQWALYRTRERLELTDPPLDLPPSRSQPAGALRSAMILASALAITVLLRADATPAEPTEAINAGDPGTDAHRATTRFTDPRPPAAALVSYGRFADQPTGFHRTPVPARAPNTASAWSTASSSSAPPPLGVTWIPQLLNVTAHHRKSNPGTDRCQRIVQRTCQ